MRAARHGILENSQKTEKDASIEGFSCRKMVQKGHEVVVDLATDPTFGENQKRLLKGYHSFTTGL